MKNLSLFLMPALLLAAPLSVCADSWKDEGRHGHERREFKEEYYDGNCKVERKLKKNGEYKEKRKCKDPGYVYYEQPPVYAPVPVVVQPGVTVNATVRLP